MEKQRREQKINGGKKRSKGGETCILPLLHNKYGSTHRTARKGSIGDLDTGSGSDERQDRQHPLVAGTGSEESELELCILCMHTVTPSRSCALTP
jgi:hypothetical protein